MTALPQSWPEHPQRDGASPHLRVLQRFLFPSSPEGLDLYVRSKHGELIYKDHRLRATPHSVLTFDAYLNSFYEAYWVQYTTVETVALVLVGKGRARCTIYRDAPVTGVEPVACEFVDLDLFGEANSVVQLRPPSHGHPGRLYIALEVDRSGLTLDRICWATPDPPLREVSLGVGICTFDRERFLLRTLDRLTSAGPEACIDHVVVVNQGQHLRSSRLAELKALESLRLHVLEQGNYGGAGGFARAALELLKRPTTTHVLFMDDDIEIDPAHLTTAAAFLGYSRERLVLGGQMLDLFDRCRMSEGGGQVTADNVVKSNHQELDLRRQESLQALAHVSLAHFNGWWFAAIPAEAFRAHGLPLPIFIRGDDMEFGIRLRQAGIPTVSLPPISVWHEPFYARPPGWKHYYDLRNRLIFASLYPEHARLDGALRLTKTLLAMIVRYDYHYVAVIQQALSDYLQGPGALTEPPAAKHAAVLAKLQVHAAQAVEDGSELPAATPPPAARAAVRRRVLLSLAGVLLGRPPSDPAGPECRIEPQAPHYRMRLGRSYVLAEPGGHFYVRFAYSWRRSWSSLASTLPIILRYRWRRRAMAAAWKAAHADLVSPETWERTLGLRPVGAAPRQSECPEPRPVDLRLRAARTRAPHQPAL